MIRGGKEQLTLQRNINGQLNSLLEMGEILGGWDFCQAEKGHILALGEKIDFNQRYFDLILSGFRKSKIMGRQGMCFKISENLCNQSFADGRIWTWNADGRICDYANHCLNYLKIGEDGIIGFDCFAGEYIDRCKGNFDVLAIKAGNLANLSLILGEIYGGDWMTDGKNV